MAIPGYSSLSKIYFYFYGNNKISQMSTFFKSLLGTGLLILLFNPVFAQQQPRYWKDIQQFKKLDKQNPPPQKAVLFIGSSSIRMWKEVQKDFPDHQVINRGFGGSTLPDVIRYAGDIIFPYHPKQVVIYCGDNDAASSDKISADSIRNRFERLFLLIRSKLPKTRITYISIKPSPSREKLFPVMEKANWEIENFIKSRRRADFVDIWHLMLDEFGRPRKELFRSDMLHMNRQGYAIWQKAVKPLLK